MPPFSAVVRFAVQQSGHDSARFSNGSTLSARSGGDDVMVTYEVSCLLYIPSSGGFAQDEQSPPLHVSIVFSLAIMSNVHCYKPFFFALECRQLV